MYRERFKLNRLQTIEDANVLTRKITAIETVYFTQVQSEAKMIDIMHEGKLKRKDFARKLAALGYPEQLVRKPLPTQIKFYANSVMGQLNKSLVYLKVFALQ